MKPAVSADRNRCAPERGVIIIFVALALFTLLAFSALVVDYGVMWVSRRQAQNAADAAAMAGARSLPINGGSNAEAALVAKLFASKSDQGAIWGRHPGDADVVVSTVDSIPPLFCPTGTSGGGACIRVDVMRGTLDRDGNPHGNTLPIFFGPLFGLASQGVRATATAQGAPGNAVSCMRPWIVADRWKVGDGTPWSQNATFNPATDSYKAPSQPDTTGFTVADNYGLQLVLKPGVIGTWSAGWTQEIDLGSVDTEDQIDGCPSFVPTVGIYNPSMGPCTDKDDAIDPARGCVHVKTGLSPGTQQGIGDLLALDSGAFWDPGTKTVMGSASTSGMSPRIVPVAFFNTLAYVNESSTCGTPGCVAQVVNIIGFFVEGMCNTVTLDPGVTCPTPSSDVVGRLMNYPGQIRSGAGSVTASASFMTVTRLVR
jgi:hypothetical protein